MTQEECFAYNQFTRAQRSQPAVEPVWKYAHGRGVLSEGKGEILSQRSGYQTFLSSAGPGGGGGGGGGDFTPSSISPGQKGVDDQWESLVVYDPKIVPSFSNHWGGADNLGPDYRGSKEGTATRTIGEDEWFEAALGGRLLELGADWGIP